MKPTLGMTYTRRQIHRMVGGGSTQSFLPGKDGRVKAGCFDLEKNSQAPLKIDFGYGPKVLREVSNLAAHPHPVPVFIKAESNHWRYEGLYRPVRISAQKEDLIGLREDAIGVVYFEPADGSEPIAAPRPLTLPAFARGSTRLPPSQQPNAGPHRTWIFQGNPDHFRIDEYLSRTRAIQWTVRQEHLAPRMAVGDRIFLWRAAGKSGLPAGIIASGRISRTPQLEEEDAVGRDLWTDDFPEGTSLRVRVDVDRVAKAKQLIQRDWLKEDPIVRDLLVLKLRSATNYEVSSVHAERLEALWSRTGVDWTEDESLAGLWAYMKTRGLPVSKSPGSPVVEVALQTGRAVTGVYNKVMNFRALDPTDQRSGLAAGGKTDRAIWDRYFDGTTQSLDSARIEADYVNVWLKPTRPTNASISTTVQPPRGTIRGQGYEPDPEVKLAVEKYSMRRAIEHYQALGFEVTDTSRGNPYDLQCTKDGLKVRVEVKGSRGDCLTIEVTIGEILNARGTAWRTDLFIVSSMLIDPGSPPVARGGEVRVIENWKPVDEHLDATRFRYRVPTT